MAVMLQQTKVFLEVDSFDAFVSLFLEPPSMALLNSVNVLIIFKWLTLRLKPLAIDKDKLQFRIIVGEGNSLDSTPVLAFGFKRFVSSNHRYLFSVLKFTNQPPLT